jgi:hypothetical protein
VGAATRLATMNRFDHILNWRLQRGSHQFPGKDGGTCINEAALVACGFPYRPVRLVYFMPRCFSRPICSLAMQLNDAASDVDRQRLIPFVTRLACADSPKIERQRAAYIRAHINLNDLHSVGGQFEQGLEILEGALAIGRQAEPLGVDDVARRMATAQKQADKQTPKQASILPAKLKSWFGLKETVESAE